jgi:phage regulator Rha-like protein
MNEIVVSNIGSFPSMSSLEIGRLCDKRHDNVLKDIEIMLSKYEASKLFSKDWIVEKSFYKDAKGENRKCYKLSKQASVDLVSGYSFEIRFLINRRWEELELKEKENIYPTKPLTGVEYAKRLLKLEEEKLALEEKNLILEVEKIDLKEDIIVKETFIDAHVSKPKFFPKDLDEQVGKYTIEDLTAMFGNLVSKESLLAILTYSGHPVVTYTIKDKFEKTSYSREKDIDESFDYGLVNKYITTPNDFQSTIVYMNNSYLIFTNHPASNSNRVIKVKFFDFCNRYSFSIPILSETLKGNKFTFKEFFDILN